jgi:hypothetical protein
MQAHRTDLTNPHVATRYDVKSGACRTGRNEIKELSINATYGREFNTAKMHGQGVAVYKDSGKQYINHRAFSLYIDGILYDFRNRDHRQAMLKYALNNGREYSVVVRGLSTQLTLSELRSLLGGLSVNKRYSTFSIKAFDIIDAKINRIYTD